MLKSTHKPSAVSTAPLASGWTEHKAPSGHTYYYNAITKQSTYTRPAAIVTPPPPPPPPTNPVESFLQYQDVALGPQAPAFIPLGNTLVPATQHQNFLHQQSQQNHHQGVAGRGGHHSQPQRPKPQPADKPKSKRQIPGHENWFVIETKLQRRFVYNSSKTESYWRIPEKLKAGILELDQQRVREKAEAWAKEQGAVKAKADGVQGAAPRPSDGEGERKRLDVPEGEDSDEYEEVEVTDEEGDEEAQWAKRQRMEGNRPEEPVEFTEEDIAFQLAQMGQEYGLEPEEYGDYEREGYEGGLEFSEEDAMALFKDMLNDSGINPFMDWDRVVDEGKLVDDGRYTSLTTMKKRKAVWDEWTTEMIAKIKDKRAKQERKDPRIPFLAFLHRNANPKLYWPEFKRKFRKENEMRASELSDKEREKMYREHIGRLKMPASTLKSDFLNLLKAQPLKELNNKTQPSSLPMRVLSDTKYISLPVSERDRLVEEYISTLPQPPEDVMEEEIEQAKEEKRERERREKALAERERRVSEEKRRQERNLAFGKGRLREEEEQIERAMTVGKSGLKSHLMDMDVGKEGDN